METTRDGGVNPPRPVAGRPGIALALTLALFVLAPAVALGETTTPPADSNGTPATVSFVDQRPLTVELADLEESRDLAVLVHNDANRPQSVRLEVVGLERAESAAVRQLFAIPPEESVVAPGTSRSFELQLGRSTRSTASPGSYEAVIAASGESGGIARRLLTVTVSDAPEDVVRGNALSPDDAGDVTLIAVNFLPSLLSRLGFFGFGAGVLLLVLAIAAWGPLRRTQRPWQEVLTGLGIFAIAASVPAVFLDTDLVGGRSVHAISSRTIAVTGQAAQGTVGVASSGNGTLARLEVAGDELRPQNLTGAGTFTGTYDLAPPKDDKGEATATINVRDFWPWALITIGLGVWVGYRMRLWFQTVRPKTRLRLRLEQALAQYGEMNRRYQEADRGEPYAGIDIGLRLNSRVEKIQTLSESGEVSAATLKLDELQDYVDRFFRLRNALQGLSGGLRTLMAITAEESFGLPPEAIHAIGDSEALTRREIDVRDPDGKAEALDESIKSVTNQTDLLVDMAQRAAAIADHLAATRAAAEDAEQGSKTATALITLEATFLALGQRALQAATTTTLDEIKVEDDTALRSLLPHLKAARASRGDEAVSIIPTGRRVAGVALAIGAEAEDQFNELAASRSVGAEPPAIEISYKALMGDLAGPLHRGDLLLMTITLTGAVPAEWRAIEIAFDGETMVQPLDRANAPMIASHVIRSGGQKSIAVRSLPDGVLRASERFSVSADTRAGRTSIRLAESEKLMNRFAFVLAVSSGLAALYLTDPSWGEPVDYLTAIVWGGVAGEGVKLAIALADRKWPTAG